MADFRVEMVVPTLHMGGMERLVVRMAQAFRESGIDVGITVIEALGPLADEARDLGIPVTLVPTPGIWTNVRARALTAHFARRRPVVVHAHSGVWLKAARAARAAGVQGVIHTFHGIVENEPWFIDHMRRAASWSTDEIVAVSESLRGVLMRQARIPERRIEVIINGVDVRRFTPANVTPPPAAGERGSFIVGHVARLDPIKNQAMLLQAFALVRQRLPHAQLIVAGNGPARRALAELAATLDLADSVTFLGEVRDTAGLYHQFDVFALSSISEGTSMSILEAMASGVPVVATAVGGTPALMRKGELGVLVPSGDVAALAEAIGNVALNPVEHQARAASARDYTVAHYSEVAMLERYYALYCRHLGGGRR